MDVSPEQLVLSLHSRQRDSILLVVWAFVVRPEVASQLILRTSREMLAHTQLLQVDSVRLVLCENESHRLARANIMSTSKCHPFPFHRLLPAEHQPMIKRFSFQNCQTVTSLERTSNQYLHSRL
jgi:hypothetical protein